MIAVARALYRLLLYTCPPAVRREDGRDLQMAFEHSLAIEWPRRGFIGRAFATGRGLVDLVAFAGRAHWEGWGRPPIADHPAARSSKMLDTIRWSWRQVRRQPAFSAAVVGMLALGMGASTALFSIVYGILLTPLPFPEPERLIQVYGAIPERGLDNISLTEANFWDMRDMNRSLEEFGALHGASFTLSGFDSPERLRGASVSAGFFRSLRVRPVAGRLFDPGEDDIGADPYRALLSHGLWVRRFGADPNIVGRPILLDDRPHLVVGVLPPGSPWLDRADVFVPFIRRADANRGSWEYTGIGRLKAGVTLAAARDDFRRVARELSARHSENASLDAAIEPSSRWIVSDQLRRVLWILLGSVVLLLAIASVNVTNLLLVRASARARDTAVRAALGATRTDLLRERLTESLMYSAAAAAIGWIIAAWMIDMLTASAPSGVPRLNEVTLNTTGLLFAASAATGVGLVTGFFAAIRTPGTDVGAALQRGQRGAIGERAHGRLRNLFVAAEVALSLVLLVGAALLVRSMVGVLSVDRGFQPENRVLMTVTIPRSYGEERTNQVARDIVGAVQQLPDVTAAATVSGRPLSGGSTGLGIVAADRPDALGAAVPWATWRVVSTDYFKAMGLPLVAGRNFSDHDEIGKPWQVVISRRLANLLWPGRDPIGQTALLWRGQGDRRGEVIGVVADMRERGLETDPTLAVYFPTRGNTSSTLQLVVHAKGRPEATVPALRAVIARIDRGLPVSDIRTMEDIVAASLAVRRLTMTLLATFAALALVLAIAGVYGVLAYSIALRTPEFGIRMALGANHRRVLRLVVAQGMQPVLAGTIVGIGATLWLSKLMAGLLFDITPRDPLTYAAVVAVLIVVAALACYMPARRVLRVDPATALRIE